jgi:hypothetical protein
MSSLVDDVAVYYIVDRREIRVDPELEAMQRISAAMSPLDEEARTRVILWLVSKFGVDIGQRSSPPPNTDDASPRAPASAGDFADLFFKANPKGHGQRALVAAYWLSLREAGGFTAQAVNGLLKNLGYQIPNITDALSQSMRERPALIVQIRKSGSNQQSRKQYRITDSGRRLVDNLTNATSTEES